MSQPVEPMTLLRQIIDLRETMPVVEFMTSPAQKPTREGWCAGVFAASYERLRPFPGCKVWLTQRQSDSHDFGLLGADETRFPFQIVECLTPGRRRGDEYQRGEESANRYPTQEEISVGSALGFEWIKQAIALKVAKQYSDARHLNLLVYANFHGMEIVYRPLQEATAQLVSTFASVWVLNGLAIGCLSTTDSAGLPSLGDGWSAVPPDVVNLAF